VVPAQDHSARARRGLAAHCGGWVPRRGGPSGSLARPSRWPTVHARGARRGAVTATEASMVVRAATAHRQLPYCGVDGKGTRAVGGVHRARGITAQLTEEVGRRWGGRERPAQRCSDGRGRHTRARAIQRRPCRSVRGRVRWGASWTEKGGWMRAGRRPSPKTGETVARRLNSLRGDGLRCSERPKGVGRRGSSWARWSEARRLCVEENRRGGGGDRRPLNRWAAWHVEMKKIGAPGSGTRCEGGGSFDKTRGRHARTAASERRCTRRGSGRQRGKRGRERGGWWVGRPVGWVPSISEMRREGERLAGGPNRNLIKFKIVQTVRN
jgi:hypothetical protein